MNTVIRITTSILILGVLLASVKDNASTVTSLSIITILSTSMLMVEMCLQSCCLPYSWSRERDMKNPNDPCSEGENKPTEYKNAA